MVIPDKRAIQCWSAQAPVECCTNKFKRCRRIFSRFDKPDRSYLDFVHFICALVWLWWDVNRNSAAVVLRLLVAVRKSGNKAGFGFESLGGRQCET